jgi:hypothetical protein
MENFRKFSQVESFRNLSGKISGKNFRKFSQVESFRNFPTMFAHRFIVAYFLTVLSTLPSFYDVTLHYL